MNQTNMKCTTIVQSTTTNDWCMYFRFVILAEHADVNKLALNNSTLLSEIHKCLCQERHKCTKKYSIN